MGTIAALTCVEKMNFIPRELVSSLSDVVWVSESLMKIMRFASSLSLLLGGCLLMSVPAQAAPKNVLVVTTTKGFRHSSIPTAEKVLADLAKSSEAFVVDYARVEPTDAEFKGADGKPDKAKVDAAIKSVLEKKMSAAALQNYDAVIFANTTGDLPLPDPQAFIAWVKSGKGFVGMHSATDTLARFEPYVDMIGGTFRTHKEQVEVQPINEDQECPACKHLGTDWKVFDEIYILDKFDPAKVHGLLTLDKHPNDKTPGNYPISWCKEYGKGRVFYTSLGHREDVWDPKWPNRKNSPKIAEDYQKHILEGIRWALGLEKWDLKKRAVE